MKLEIYLDGNVLETGGDVDFVLNKQFTDLTDLTSIIVDYTKTIRVPMTPYNNNLFNHTYKLEHRVLVGEDIITYDPSQKIPMQMVFNGSMVMEGYAILNSIDLSTKTYEINLYGQLGKIFSILKDKTLKDYQDTGTGSGWWSRVRMNTLNIKKSVNNEQHRIGWTSTDWTDFFGFAPQLIGRTNKIDTKSMEQLSPSQNIMFKDAINTARNITYGEQLVGDGLDFNQYPECRTYMTRPYVYVDKLCQLVKYEINNHPDVYDGYTLNLDDSWFDSTTNPAYYYQMVYFPGRENIVDDGGAGDQEGTVTWNTSQRSFNYSPYLPPTSSIDLNGFNYVTSGTQVRIEDGSGNEANVNIILDGNNIVMKERVSCTPTSDFVTKGKWAYYNMSKIAEVPVRYIGVYDGSDTLVRKLYLIDNEVYSVQLGGTYAKVRGGNMWSDIVKNNPLAVVPFSCTNVNSTGSNYVELTQTFNFGNISLNTSVFTFKTGWDVIDLFTGKVVTNSSISSFRNMCPFKNDKYKTLLGSAESGAWFTPVKSMAVTGSTFRSGSYWTVNDILGNDFNPFQWFINYCKMFRLYWDIDYRTKVITVRSDYFNEYQLSYKEVIVDYSRPMIIEPIIEKYRNVNFGYKENESTKEAQYKKVYGVAYGDMNIQTGIDITNESLSLSPDKNLGVWIPTKMDALAYVTMINSSATLATRNVLYSNEVINTLDKDGNIEYYPFYAFRVANTRRSSAFWTITDDTPKQIQTGKYSYLMNEGWSSLVQYTQDGTDVYYQEQMNTMPQFDNYFEKTEYESGTAYRNLYWSTFATPKEVYNDYLPSYHESRGFIYRWTNYLNELFNINNKKVTCYVRMSYPEFINFKFNQFFVIDHCIFLVNKIIDFNPNSLESTRVELIQIDDVNNLR